MWKTIATIAIALLIFAIMAASRRHDQRVATTPPVMAQIFSGPGGVAFHIEPEAETAPNTFVWPATYSSNGHIAKFKIELVVPQPSADKDQITFGKGHFLAVPGSDPTTLISALQKALEAKTVPKTTQHLESLPFTYAILGTKQTRGKEGGFNSDPSGNWIAMKIFLGSEEPDQGEVFLNMDPVNGHAEFSIKDPDYGDIVLRHLITIL